MSASHKDRSFYNFIKDYYIKAENAASEAVPYYVAGDGVMFTDPKEVLQSGHIIRQLDDFESLRVEISESFPQGEVTRRIISK